MADEFTDEEFELYFQGHYSAMMIACGYINRMLDGEEPHGVGQEPWESTRRRVWALVKRVKELDPKLAPMFCNDRIRSIIADRDRLAAELKLEQQGKADADTLLMMAVKENARLAAEVAELRRLLVLSREWVVEAGKRPTLAVRSLNMIRDIDAALAAQKQHSP